MPVDPQILALLDVMAAAGGKPVEELTVAEARAGAEAWIGYGGPGEPVARVLDRYIPGPTADIHIRVYWPAAEAARRDSDPATGTDAPTPPGTPPAALPALVLFHGSGWVISNITHAEAPHRELANRSGCVVVAVNYQKAPEHKFPVPLDDCWAAACWVVDNAALLGVDPARVGVGGDSAGGNLATACCIRARDTDGPRFALQLLIYPTVDLCAPADRYPSMVECADGPLLTRASMEWFWGAYVARPEDADDPLASPIRCRDLSGLPPAIVMTAEYDPLRDEGEAYADRLAAAGVPTVKRRYAGATHAVYWMTGSVDLAHTLIADLGRDVRGIMAAARP